VGARPGPSESDKNHPWPQIIVDKTQAYWIQNPATDYSQLPNLQWRTIKRQQCDLLSYQ